MSTIQLGYDKPEVPEFPEVRFCVEEFPSSNESCKGKVLGMPRGVVISGSQKGHCVWAECMYKGVLVKSPKLTSVKNGESDIGLAKDRAFEAIALYVGEQEAKQGD